MLEEYLVLFKQNYVLVAFAFLGAYLYTRLTAPEESADNIQTLISSALVALAVFIVIYIHGLSDSDYEEIYTDPAQF